MLKELIYFGIILMLSFFILGCVQEKIDISVPEQETNKNKSSLDFDKEKDVFTNFNKTQLNSSLIVKEKSEARTLNSWYKPTPGTSWQWQLSGTINTDYNVEMYDVDLVETQQFVIDELHDKGKKVICYFSAGSWEEFRKDSDDFPKEVLGNTLEGWEDEKWLDISKIELLAPIIKNRMDLAVEKGCDGVEPDNVDAYQNDNGFSLTYQDQLRYNKWLSEEAHKRGLSIGLKNDLDQINELVDYFDFAVNEQCFEYDECEMNLPFIKQGKAVFGVEYELETKEFCREANEMKFSWLKMEYDLDGGRISCND